MNQYLVEYIAPEIQQEQGFASGGRCYPYCYVQAESESTAIAAANEISGIDATLTVENCTARSLRANQGETLEESEFARLSGQWHRV